MFVNLGSITPRMCSIHVKNTRSNSPHIGTTTKKGWVNAKGVAQDGVWQVRLCGKLCRGTLSMYTTDMVRAEWMYTLYSISPLNTKIFTTQKLFVSQFYTINVTHFMDMLFSTIFLLTSCWTIFFQLCITCLSWFVQSRNTRSILR